MFKKIPYINANAKGVKAAGTPDELIVLTSCILISLAGDMGKATGANKIICLLEIAEQIRQVSFNYATKGMSTKELKAILPETEGESKPAKKKKTVKKTK